MSIVERVRTVTSQGSTVDPSTDARCLTNAGLMLAQRLWRWASINPALDQRLVFAVGFWAFIHQ